MKKALIALMVLAGVAPAATLGTIDTTDEKLEAYFDYAESADQKVGDITGWNEKMTWNSAGQYGTTGQTNSMYTDGGMNINMKNDGGFTISFDINNINTTGTILSVLTNHQNASIEGAAIWRGMKADIARDDTTGAYTLNTLLGSKTLTANLGADLSWTTLTFVGTANTEGVTQNDMLTMDLAIYVNGELADSFSDYGAWNFVAENLNRLQFGHWGNSSQNTQLDIDNILIYSRPLSKAEVKNLTIPEPTTATLSLLALCGLAARRRRK